MTHHQILPSLVRFALLAAATYFVFVSVQHLIALEEFKPLWWLAGAGIAAALIPMRLTTAVLFLIAVLCGVEAFAPSYAAEQITGFFSAAIIGIAGLATYLLLFTDTLVNGKGDDKASGGHRNGLTVGLSGWARSGKDTAAEQLLADGDWTQVSFAAPLKNLALQLNPWITVGPTVIRFADLVDRHGWTEAKKNPEVRKFLQDLGDGARVHISDNVWIDAAVNSLPAAGNVVITDARYVNEIKAIEAIGGVVVRINRPGGKPANDHPTEIALNDYPFAHVIDNDGTMRQLGARLRTAIRDAA